MITIADIKSYLKITETTYDTVLKGFINSVVSEIEKICNRKFKYKSYAEYLDGNDMTEFFLSGYPIHSVEVLQYYDDVTDDYVDLIDGDGDTIANTLTVTDESIVLRKGYYFWSGIKSLYIEYTAGYKAITGTGTLSILTGTKAVTGVNTLFATECEVGDIIQSEGQDFEIDVITSNTVLTVTENANATISGKSFVVKTTPDDLKQVVIEKTALKFFDSAQNKGRLGVSSENVGSQANQSYTFKEVDHSGILDKYKKYSL